MVVAMRGYIGLRPTLSFRLVQELVLSNSAYSVELRA
jgi:hypothetical protein